MEVSQVAGIECGLNPDEISGYVKEQMGKHFDCWIGKIEESPENFAEVEREVLDFGRNIAGLLVAGILANGKTRQRVKGEAEAIRRQSGLKWRYVRRTCLGITLLCGLTISVFVGYWLPRREKCKAGRPRGIGKRGMEGIGLYPELAALGIREGVTSPLQEDVSHTAVLMPSFKLSQQELSRRGIELDVKAIHRITLEFGEQALSARKVEIERWRKGELAAGTVFKGRCVVVAIDGGRTRIRQDRRGKKNRNGRHRFQAPWREPKLLIIYAVDQKGRRDPGIEQVIDTSMQGPDHIAELAAFYLHRSGAAEAEEVVFLCDGAEWIWDRVPMIAKKAGLVKWSACVDFCHTMGYIGKAVMTAGWDRKEHKRYVRKIRMMLLKGRVDDALKLLEALPNAKEKDEIRSAVGYITKRRALIQYDQLRRKGLPIGSGAVESAIRRVINLRIKGPGMFWKEDNVEAVMHLRANALSGQWGSMLRSVQRYSRTTRQRDWKCSLTPFSVKDEENELYLLPQLVMRKAA